jgi:hypothetical protein
MGIGCTHQRKHVVNMVVNMAVNLGVNRCVNIGVNMGVIMVIRMAENIRVKHMGWNWDDKYGIIRYDI